MNNAITTYETPAINVGPNPLNNLSFAEIDPAHSISLALGEALRSWSLDPTFELIATHEPFNQISVPSLPTCPSRTLSHSFLQLIWDKLSPTAVT